MENIGRHTDLSFIVIRNSPAIRDDLVVIKEMNVVLNGCLTSHAKIFQFIYVTAHICAGRQSNSIPDALHWMELLSLMCRRTEEEVGPTVGLPTP